MAKIMPVLMNRLLKEDVAGFATSEQDMFGVEVELEGTKIVTANADVMKHWVAHPDGSLRTFKPDDESIEYVFRQPYNYKDTKEALKALFKYLTENPGTKVYDSYRTSIHVHINCLEDTARTIVNFITLAIIFDELFVSQNGECRAGNNFCLRSKDAEGQIADLCQTFSKYGNLFNLNSNDRYSSVNFGSLVKFGTVEFRSMECTTDLDRVLHWIKTIQALKISARKYENPHEIISKFSKHGPFGFMITHLGEQYTKYSTVPGAHQMLQNGMRLAQDFAFCSSWQLPKEGEKIRAPSRRRGPLADNFPNLNHAVIGQVLAGGVHPDPVGGWWDHVIPADAGPQEDEGPHAEF